jgi:phosphodiesterase/alkaline phosphatase D-like protein
MKQVHAISTLIVKMNTIQIQSSKPFLIFSVLIICVTILLIGGVSIYHGYAKNNLAISHGITSGDVTEESAIVWSRANNDSQMNVMYDTDPGFNNPILVNTTNIVNSTIDYTSTIRLQHLEPNTVYHYREAGLHMEIATIEMIIREPIAIGMQ